jgi:branched-chain amino acid transport system ATP-binding protein
MISDLVHLPTRTRLERTRRAEVADVIELCGLSGIRWASAASLPIGPARLLELGRALVDKPKVLLLDEPTSGLGVAEVETVRRVLDQLRVSAECAVLLVEHDTSFVMSECEFVYVLAAGSVLASGTPDKIRDDAAVKAAYLG